MRIVGVVMVDRSPLKPGVQVALHLRNQLARVVPQIQPDAILRRNDQAEEPFVARPLPAAEQLGEVEVVAFGVEAEPLLALALRAVARQIAPRRCP